MKIYTHCFCPGQTGEDCNYLRQVLTITSSFCNVMCVFVGRITKKNKWPIFTKLVGGMFHGPRTNLYNYGTDPLSISKNIHF